MAILSLLPGFLFLLSPAAAAGSPDLPHARTEGVSAPVAFPRPGSNRSHPEKPPEVLVSGQSVGVGNHLEPTSPRLVAGWRG
jgi:hypothetical protein